MISHPFSFLERFGIVDVCFLQREDACGSDDDIARLTGKKSMVSLHQVHGNLALAVREPSSRILQADALATDVPGLTLTIRFADCQGFVLFDPTKNVVAVIHAGWKGMCKKIISSTFTLLREKWGIDAAHVFVGAGPSLCTSCAEFTDPLREAPELAPFIRGRSIDLMAAADAELLSLGVQREKFHRMPQCTRCHPEMYFTYRGGDRDAVMRGRTNAFAITMVTQKKSIENH